jgi:hypothetical protein
VTVVLNNAAIERLFTSVPVVRHVAQQAEKVADKMREDVRSYYVGAETGAENDVGSRIEGNSVIVGLRDDPEGNSTHVESKSARYARVGRWEKTHQLVNQ